MLLRVADLLQRDKAAIARMESLDTGKRLAESEIDVDDVTSVFRHYGESRAHRARAARRRGPRRRRVAGRPRARRRLRPDHAVELPAPPGRLEGRALPRRGQHLRAQAQRADAAHGDPPDAAAGGGRRPRRRRQPGARRRRRCGGSALDGPACRPGVLHRRRRDRQAADGQRRRHREEDRPRARRQEPQHRLRRRRPGGRARQRADRRVPALRPGVLGRGPAAGRGEPPRRAGRGDRPSAPARSGSAARSTTTPRPAR